MKNRMKWMMLAVVAVVFTSVWADTPSWNPDNATDLKFKLNFDANTATTTTDTVSAWVGTVTNANDVAGFDVNGIWNPNGAVGKCADFKHQNDYRPWGAPNDVRLNTTKSGSNVINFSSGPTKRTWSFWFNDYDANTGIGNDPNYIFPYLFESCFLRHQNYGTGTNDPNIWWDMCIRNARIMFRCNKSDARMTMSTQETCTDMNVMPYTWHHVAFVIDRSTIGHKEKNKIFVDGLEVPVDFPTYTMDPNKSMNCNNASNTSPLSVGAVGTTKLPWKREGEFDGKLDDIRCYNRALTPVEVSIIYQTDYKVHPIALKPIPKSEEVSIATDLEWEPATGATAQTVYFGTDKNNMVLKKTDGTGTLTKVVNADVNGPLYIDTDYYWRVNSTVGGNPVVGPNWVFTTEVGKALNPSPANAQERVAVGRVNLTWVAPNATSFDVYFSSDQSKVTAKDPNVREPNKTAVVTDQNIASPAIIPGARYYWCVVSKYPHSLQAPSDTWYFRTGAYPIVFNTSSDENVYFTYRDVAEQIPAYKCKVNGPSGSWSELATGYLRGDTDGKGGVAVFNFPSGFDYNDRYDIIVVPDYEVGTDATYPPTPLDINVTGKFYFNGTIDISGDDGDDIINPDISPKARCGGHRGPRKEPSPGVPTKEIELGYYPQAADTPIEFESLSGTQQMHNYYPPTVINSVSTANPSGYDVFGLGTPLTPPYKNSGGGGYGGKGGDSGRGYIHVVPSVGATYGDKEIPIPFGGSAASWAQSTAGPAGGGGVEIDSTSDVNLGGYCKIIAHGGTTPYVVQYPAGGGAGGSVKIVADGNVTIASGAIIDVNGGDGGNGNEKGNNTGGGGGGGRVAIFYGGTYTKTGAVISAKGGAKGVITTSPGFADHIGKGLSFAGEDGTIYEKSYMEASPRKASAPTPRDGDNHVYCPNNVPTAFTLKWYSGYNRTPAFDQVYCDTNSDPTITVGTPVSATRGQHSSTTTKTLSPDTTYHMKVVTTPVDINFGAVTSDVWTFKTVGWKCLYPRWGAYYVYGSVDSNLAGFPAWDADGDCRITESDFWPQLAKYWRYNRGGSDYQFGISEIYMFASEWLGCRARVTGLEGKTVWNMCDDWPLPPNWIPADEYPR